MTAVKSDDAAFNSYLLQHQFNYAGYSKESCEPSQLRLRHAHTSGFCYLSKQKSGTLHSLAAQVACSFCRMAVEPGPYRARIVERASCTRRENKLAIGCWSHKKVCVPRLGAIYGSTSCTGPCTSRRSASAGGAHIAPAQQTQCCRSTQRNTATFC